MANRAPFVPAYGGVTQMRMMAPTAPMSNNAQGVANIGQQALPEQLRAQSQNVMGVPVRPQGLAEKTDARVEEWKMIGTMTLKLKRKPPSASGAVRRAALARYRKHRSSELRQKAV